MAADQEVELVVHWWFSRTPDSFLLVLHHESHPEKLDASRKFVLRWWKTEIEKECWIKTVELILVAWRLLVFAHRKQVKFPPHEFHLCDALRICHHYTSHGTLSCVHTHINTVYMTIKEVNEEKYSFDFWASYPWECGSLGSSCRNGEAVKPVAAFRDCISTFVSVTKT